jgi:hypothetical protein
MSRCWEIPVAFLIMGLTPFTATAEEVGSAGDAPPRIGPFNLGASVSVTGEYTDNVYSTENDRVGDFITIMAPEVSLSAASEEFSIDLEAASEFGFFASETSEDYFDTRLSAEAQWNMSPTTYLFGGIDHAWEHENRSSADEVHGSEPTQYRDASAFGGLVATVDPVTLRIGVNLRQFDFDDTPAAGATSINNDDRDRVHAEIGGRVGYKVNKNSELFLQGVVDRRHYEEPTDDFGADRDSSGFNAAAGYRGKVGPFQGEILGGVLHQSYDGSGLSSITAPDLGAELSWRPNRATSVNLEIDRRLEETTLDGASGNLASSAVLRGGRWIASDTRATGYLAYTANDYRGIDRTDYIAEAGLGLQHFLSPNIYVSTGYEWAQRTSDAPGADYDRHTVYLRLGADLVPQQRPAGRPARFDGDGFYAGLQLGDGLLKTGLSGPRGAPDSDGSLSADFGDFGFAGGAFAGYRAELGDLVLGGEIDAWLEDAAWHHDGNRDFSVEALDSFGISALTGLRLRNDVILYGRMGVVGTKLETRYARGVHDLKQTEREPGLRFGLGAEFPLSGSLSGRMEYSLTAYPDYDFGAPPGRPEDNFSNATNLASFGLVYHFGSHETEPVKPVEFGGFYVGTQIGHGALATDNSGPRPADEDPAFLLDVDRAGMGATGGIFAGYGHRFGPFYLGGEVEAELSNANWDIERDPNGRVYSVEKTGSVGAALRAGYVVNDAVLIYGRAGLAHSWFDTDYSIGDVSIERTTSDSGLRLGAGIEFAVSDDLRMRLDYTRTDYGSYTVDYGAGVDSFSNAENLFRIGILHSF